MMWLDPVYMLPIAILGLEKLAKGKPWLYVFALTFSICSNYYISFSVCIFLIIYFIYYSLLNKVDFKKFLFNFIKYSIISALLSSVILLPTIFNMINGKFETAGTDYSFSLLYNPIILIYKFLILDSKQVLSDLPFITSSLLILLLTPLYLFCKNITKKEKIVTYSVIVLLILITLFPFTDTIMHCFRLPNQFTCRYAFIVSFFLILTLSKCFDEAEFNKKNILLYLIAGFFIRFYLKLCIDFRTIISSILILAYFILVIFMKNKKLLAIAIIPFVILELLLNVSAHFRELGRRWYGEYQKLWAHEEKIEVLKPDQNNFYRISGLSHFTYNDALAYKYYGVTSFSPTVSVTTNKILKDYFASPLTESYAIDYVSTTAFSDSLLNVKYKYMINNDPGDEQEDFASYENKYVFPVMFKITQNDYFKEGKTKIETQNNLYKYLTNTDDILFEETENYIIKGCHYENDTMYVDEEGFCSFKLTDENNQYYVELSGASNLMTPVYDGIVTTEHYSGTFILDVNGDARVFFSEKEVK